MHVATPKTKNETGSYTQNIDNKINDTGVVYTST